MQSHGSQRSNYIGESNPYRTPAQKRYVDKAIFKTAKMQKSVWGNNDLFVYEWIPSYQPR